jgi:uncharacterized protein YqeY
MLVDTIQNDIKTAMKQGQKEVVETLRMLTSDIKKWALIDQKKDFKTVTDDEAVTFVSKAIKTRKESIDQFRQGGRPELAEKEQREIDILIQYLPQQLTLAEVEIIVTNLIAELNVSGKAGMGKVMKELMARYKGQIDGKAAQQVINTKLGPM